MGNRMEARKSRARAGSAGCDRRTMRTDGSRAAASRLPSPRTISVWREPFWSSKKGCASIAVNVTEFLTKGEKQCTRAEKGVGMRACVCVCVTACANVYVGCGDLVSHGMHPGHRV